MVVKGGFEKMFFDQPHPNILLEGEIFA